MQTLTWHRIDATHHELRDQDGIIWGDIAPHVTESKFVVGQLKATCRHPDFRNGMRPQWFGVGSNVTTARMLIESYLDVQANRTIDLFTFA